MPACLSANWSGMQTHAGCLAATCKPALRFANGHTANLLGHRGQKQVPWRPGGSFTSLADRARAASEETHSLAGWPIGGRRELSSAASERFGCYRRRSLPALTGRYTMQRALDRGFNLGCVRGVVDALTIDEQGG